MISAIQSMPSGLNHPTVIVLSISILIYLFVMLFVGWWSSQRVNRIADFMVAGRQLPLWLATMTLLAGWFGAGSSMGITATVYSDGLSGVVADPFGASVSLLLAGVFIVAALRRARCLTVTDIIAKKYGKAAGAYATLWMIPVYVGWLGAQMLGLGTIFQILLGWELWVGTVVGAMVVLICTIAGGFWAVSFTDVIQFALIVIGFVILLPGAVSEAGGWDILKMNLEAADLSIGVKAVTGGTAFNDWIFYIGSWIVMGLGCAVGQDLIQCSLAAKNSKIAAKSSIISGFVYFFLACIPVVIGFCARIVLPKHGVSAEMISGDLENQVLVRMAILIFGNGGVIFLIIFLSALVSAIVSSATSSLMASSSLLFNNIIRPYREIPKNKLLLHIRIVTLVMVILSVFFALMAGSIYQLMINSWASLLVIVFVPVVGALYVKTSSAKCAWTTMIVSGLVWLVYMIMHAFKADLSFTQFLAEKEFIYIYTCGAVYGFFAAVIVFATFHLIEKFRRRCKKSMEVSPNEA